ncbi:MAG: LysE family transporter, partial [Alphaproteobacteria bacterium]|nr:LysE family transporter [Alphaproteobacteria bacterium]
CVHVFYTVIGIAALMAQSTLMFTVIKYIGAAYLIYIGTKAILSKGDPSHLEEGEPNPNTAAVAAPAKCMSALAALRSGFITNLFNPKATLFFLAMFTQIIGPETPVHVQIFFGMTCALICAGWFSAVALVLTKPRVKKVFLRIAKWIDRVCGGLMIALGLKLAVAR